MMGDLVAPSFPDIVWENIHYTRRQWWKFLLVYPLLIAFLVCFTTPEYLTTKFEELLALGAQAGEKRLREVVTEGGFTKFRRATETPFNMVLEARP